MKTTLKYKQICNIRHVLICFNESIYKPLFIFYDPIIDIDTLYDTNYTCRLDT